MVDVSFFFKKGHISKNCLKALCNEFFDGEVFAHYYSDHFDTSLDAKFKLEVSVFCV
jgi:hypothetical protein